MGYFEPSGGFLNPENCIKAQLVLAQKAGAQLRTGEMVMSYKQDGETVIVTTNVAEYRTRTLVVTAGTGLLGLLDEALRQYFTIKKQTQFWFEVENPADFTPENFPSFVYEQPKEPGKETTWGNHGFPITGTVRNAIKIASRNEMVELAGLPIPRFQPDPKVVEKMYRRYVRPILNGVTNKCVRASVCAQIYTPDAKFIITQLPQQPQVILVSACSGHGFKHSPRIGKMLAQWIFAGQQPIDLHKFAFTRFSQQ